MSLPIPEDWVEEHWQLDLPETCRLAREKGVAAIPVLYQGWSSYWLRSRLPRKRSILCCSQNQARNGSDR